MTPPRIACIMPFLNEARYLSDVLATVSAQTVAHERLYIIGVDNGSTDGSGALFEAWLRQTGLTGELVREPIRSIPRALNAGLARTRLVDVIVRLDAHAIYGVNYLAAIDAAFESLPTDVWCVGGAPTPPLSAEGYGAQLGIALYSNPLGLGPADFRRDAPSAREVTTVYLGAFRPGVLARLGGFDERWCANEDCELTERIRANGGRIFRIPLDVARVGTRGAVAMVRQWARYGFWRMQTFKCYPSAIRPRHIAPPIVLALGLGLLATRWRMLLPPLYGLYAYATVRSRRPGEPPAVTAGTLVFFPLLQAGYALGLLAGVLYTPAQLRGRRRGQSQYGYYGAPRAASGDNR